MSPPARTPSEHELTRTLRLLDQHGFQVELDLGGCTHTCWRRIHDSRTGRPLLITLTLTEHGYDFTVVTEIPGHSVHTLLAQHDTWHQRRPPGIAQYVLGTVERLETGHDHPP